MEYKLRERVKGRECVWIIAEEVKVSTEMTAPIVFDNFASDQRETAESRDRFFILFSYVVKDYLSSTEDIDFFFLVQESL